MEHEEQLIPDITIPRNISDIELKYLKDIISNRLMNKLKLFDCRNIEDVHFINLENFKAMDSIGTTTINEFIELKRKILSDHKSILKTYNDNKEVELIYKENNSFFSNIELLVIGYFELLGDPKASNIFEKRFALNSSQVYTLEEIGLFYNITRERVRQIQDKHLNKIKSLLSGEKLKKPYCKANTFLVQEYKKFESEILEKSILCEKEIQVIIENCGIKFSPEKHSSILNLLLTIIGCNKYTYDDFVYYIVASEINHKDFEKICSQVVQILRDENKPITYFDLVLKVKKRSKKITKDLLDNVLGFLPFIETTQGISGKSFQIEFSKLTSLKEYAYRILFEKNEVMHYSEIWREIQHRLIQSGLDIRESSRSLNGQMVSDRRFVPIGRTGMWGLFEWNNDTSSIIELIIKSFYHYNRPCSIQEIAEYISEIRPQIKQHSIYSIISQHKEKFLKLPDNLLILKEWSNHYDAGTELTISYDRISMSDFCKITKEIFEKNSNQELTIKEIKQELENYDIFWNESYCHIKFSKCPSLISEKKDNKLYFTYNLAYKEDHSSSVGKLESLKNKIINLFLERNEKKIPLNVIVSELSKIGEKKHNIYSVVSKNSDIFKKNDDGQNIVVEYKGSSNKQKLSKEKNKHERNIINGESKKIEFKSSLRWDLKENKINKELEFMVIKAITAFMNTDGGILYIGVSDDSEILGIENDYKTFSKKNRDGFLLHLNNLLIRYFTKNIFSFVEPNIESMKGKDIAIIVVKSSNEPVFIKYDGEELFLIRGSASVQKLDMKEAFSYIKLKWNS